MDRRSTRPEVGTLLVVALAFTISCGDEPTGPGSGLRSLSEADLDQRLDSVLDERDISGHLEDRLMERLGRSIDPELADVGRLLFFDPILSLTEDNSCSGCHGPNVGFNGSRSIAIGVGNNGVVGAGRSGPHNLRRAPTVVNAAFYPRMMWDGRFEAKSLDPFDNRAGFSFPEPEGESLSHLDHLLVAQAFTPVVAREEMAGFDFQGGHEAMRDEIARRVDAVGDYRARFAAVDARIAGGGAVGYEDLARAIAEFTFTLVRADAPIDAFARGDHEAMTAPQKRGGLLFFGKALCGECHITNGFAGEMFSDFESHALGVPQITPIETNVTFDGADRDQDFGRERVTGDRADRYRFRTSPLRNAGYQPSFMHNGAYLCMEDAIRHHLDAVGMLDGFTTEHLGPSLGGPVGPVSPMLDRLHDISRTPPTLTEGEFEDVVAFVRGGLSDPAAHPARLRALIPASVPSGLPVHDFQFDQPSATCTER